MPWLETVPVEERIRFIWDALSDRFTMSALCARYGVSRRVGYKWLARYEEEGRRGLRDRSRAPHHCPHRVDGELAEMICEFRRKHPFWGARRLLRVFATRNPSVATWPAPSEAELCRAAESLRFLSGGVQHRASPRAAESGNSGLTLHRVTAPISVAATPARVPGSLPRQESHHWWNFPPSGASRRGDDAGQG
jgi:transposase